MKLKFQKYHGTGNDFILIDNRDGNIRLSTEQVARLCDRHLGIGADGLILMNTKPGYDFGMTYFNADGNESTLCGNGGRCIVAFAHSLGLIKHRATFTAVDGEHTASILGRKDAETQVKLKMSDVSAPSIEHRASSIEYPASGIQINTGSPHLVIFKDKVRDLDVVIEGRKIHQDKRLAQDGTNVDFIQVHEDHLFVRTYERGVEDETLSCGTGVTAAALAYASLQSSVRSPQSPVTSYNIQTLGGNLTVSFHKHKGTFTDIWLEGPAEFVYHGEISF